MYYLLLYDYVPDILEKRDPYRPEHLALVRGLHAKGVVIMAGAWANPPHGAALLFKAPDKGAVEAFVGQDPYVKNGLVTRWQIREWAVGIGGTP